MSVKKLTPSQRQLEIREAEENVLRAADNYLMAVDTSFGVVTRRRYEDYLFESVKALRKLRSLTIR